MMAKMPDDVHVSIKGTTETRTLDRILLEKNIRKIRDELEQTRRETEGLKWRREVLLLALDASETIRKTMDEWERALTVEMEGPPGTVVPTLEPARYEPDARKRAKNKVVHRRRGAARPGTIRKSANQKAVERREKNRALSKELKSARSIAHSKRMKKVWKKRKDAARGVIGRIEAGVSGSDL